MENASKALIMAGGMLIAIAIISVSLYAYNKAQGYASTSNDLLNANQIQSFNRFYTSFGDGSETTIKCIDAINLLNRAIEDELTVNESSAKINSYAYAGSTIYTVDGNHTEYYIQDVKYSFTRDVQGRVLQVTITD